MPDFYHPRTNTPTEKMLAGQPQDPPWQSSEQDQVRPSWQAFGAPPADKETYSYPQSGQATQAAQSAQNAQSGQGYGQGYAQQAQQGGYPPPSYTVQGQAYGAQDHPYADQAHADQAYQ